MRPIEVKSDLPLPDYMEPDSYGPAVNLVIKFLNAWARKERPHLTPAFENDIFGGQATRLMIFYQKARGIEADGGCGPQTRACMAARDNFILSTEVMHRALDGISAFVQPDGSTLYWAPFIGIRSGDRGVMEMIFRKSRQGN